MASKDKGTKNTKKKKGSFKKKVKGKKVIEKVGKGGSTSSY